ncbi:hypothetical protein ABPG75_010944 [Micractinium tetrahymenae]
MGRKRVLIVGGGYAGVSAAALLCCQFEVTLLDPKTFFEPAPMAPHSLVVPASAPATLVDFPAAWHPKQGLLVGLTSNGARGTATLQSGEAREFDYALLATGSSYPGAIKPPVDQLTDRAARLKAVSDVGRQVAAAAAVVVVGGGSVGIEVAAEVAERFPGKKVTLVCSGGLLERMDGRARDFAAAWLLKHGVEVLTGERISDWGGLGDGAPAPATLRTASGREISGDIVFKCVGVRPATALFAGSLSAEQRAPNGSIAVEPTLQVRGWRNVFAAGDCTNTPEEKTAAFAGVAATVAAGNIIVLHAGKELKTYPEGTFGGLLPPMAGGFTLGASAGVLQIGSNVQTGAGPAKAKGVINWLFARIAHGSRFWAWLYGNMRVVMVKSMTREARKAAARKEAAAAHGTAAVGAAAPAAA